MANSPSELFIVDNSDSDWKVRSYLSDWCELSKSIDIATGYFEIGALLCLNEKWQSVDHIRILMGDEVSYRTKRAFAHGLRNPRRLDQSIEGEKMQNDFLEACRPLSRRFITARSNAGSIARINSTPRPTSPMVAPPWWVHLPWWALPTLPIRVER